MTPRPFVTVREVMSTAPQVVDGLATVREAVNLMREHGVSSVIVDRRDRGDEYGIVVIHDVAEQVIGRNRSPDRTNVYEIMSKPVVWVRPGMNIRYCARLFHRFGISIAPVIEGDEIEGVVTYKQLVLQGLAAQQ